MRPSVMIANEMESQIGIARKGLAEGVHMSGVLESLKILNDVRKIVENFEISILADIYDID
jgi:hypothetical protein